MSFFSKGTYDIFLTHAWSYTDEWQSVVLILDKYLPGKWRNWSLPWHDTSIERFSSEGREQLGRLLHGHISMSSAVLFLPGPLNRAEGRLWLEKEMDVAAALKKPVIGVRLSPDTEFPPEFNNRIATIVNADGAEIISAINSCQENAIKYGRSSGQTRCV